MSLAVYSSYRKSICPRLSKYSASGLWRVGWKCCQLDTIRHESYWIDMNRVPSCQFVILEINLSETYKNIAHLGFEGGLKMLSIRHDLIDSTWIVSLAVDLSYQKSICARLKKYSASGLWGWVENVVDSTRFDRIDTNPIPCCRFIIPEVDLRET